jgi:hypothetical protein
MTELPFEPADFEEKLHAALRMPDPDPAYVEALLSRVHNTPPVAHPARPSRKQRLLAISACAVIEFAAIFLLAGPQQVVSAVRGWLSGYVPNWGYVDSSDELLGIPAPIRLERDESFLTIDQAFSDSQRTVIILGESYFAQPCSSPADTQQYTSVPEPYLMAGNERLDVQNTWASYLTFDPLPDQVHEATLYIPFQTFCEDDAPDWAVQLVFEPLPAGTLLPTVESSPTFESIALPIPSESSPEVTLTLDNMVELPDSVIFSGTLSWTGGDSIYRMPYAEELSYPDAVTLMDADGETFLLEKLPDDETQALYPDLPANATYWAYRMQGQLPNGPLTLSFPAVLRLSGSIYGSIDGPWSITLDR